MGMFDDLRKLDGQPFQPTSAASPAAPQPPGGAIAALNQQPPVKTIKEPQEAPALPTTLAARAGRLGARVGLSPAPASSVDLKLVLAETPFRKDTFLFTTEEFEAFEDLKLRLRRSLDVKVTKNDLARCAIAHFVAEVNRDGESSPLIAPLLNRRGR